MAKGRFITFEGGEGAGKSTQLALLAERLRAMGQRVVTTREPGGTDVAERLRGLLLAPDLSWSPLAETLLHFAARADHVAQRILPALEAGEWVVCDRFADSTMAYQGFGQGGDRGRIASLAAMMGIVPDLTFVLDVSPATSRARLAARGGSLDRYERLGEGFFARVRVGFAAIAAAEPARCVLIPAEEPPEMVAERVWRGVVTRLGVGR